MMRNAMVGDIPTISNSTYTATAYSPVSAGGVVGLARASGTTALDMWQPAAFRRQNPQWAVDEAEKALERMKEHQMAAQKRRLVQVFIVDPDERVPLDQALLYKGEQKFTDATDQELFFEIDIKTLLEEHNAKRVTIKDKKVKEREEMLEPAKIRDLKMLVVTAAEF